MVRNIVYKIYVYTMLSVVMWNLYKLWILNNHKKNVLQYKETIGSKECKEESVQNITF